ncbi:MAG: sigma-70 family RNA polymerase sigma factor [Planctomycetaceae bacterium]|nr:sigma-70 family RNA polymerase sigma factor [Planctomycetaceae bacterium]
MNEWLDEQLIARTLDGDPAAFDQLVVRYQDRLVHSLEHALGSREDALDVAQIAFVQAWRKLESFRGASAFYSWLYRIARNAAVSRKRRNRIQASSLDRLTETSGIEPVDDADGASPDRRLAQNEDVALVQSALQQLPEDFRQTLVLKEIDGFSYEEIAAILDIPLGTVRSRISRARQELVDRLRRETRD